ncbi:MAG: hybrid sensor histidine kinase/response regulator [Bacteroidota bacterium]
MCKTLIAAIDDEIINIEIIKFVIKGMDYDFLGIDNSLEAIELLSANKPDLILMDVQMPNMDGFELCEQIKLNDFLSSIPIIFLTGMNSSENKIKGLELGGIDYVTKPFNKQELAARITTHVNLVKANSKIEEQAKVLERDNVLKNRLFSIIGHDLRSPLSAVKMQLDFIIRGIIDPHDEQFIDTTVHNLAATTDEAFNLLDNLLGWAKSESGILSMIEEKLNIKEIVEQNVRLVQMALNAKKIDLELKVPEEAYVHTDLNMFKMILRNLLSNAIKFTAKQGKITISAVSKNNSWSIGVEDTGTGMSKDELAKIRDTKEHFSKTGTEEEAGTGLGLVLCQDFVKKVGGELTIVSELGKGSLFSFDLPKVS